MLTADVAIELRELENSQLHVKKYLRQLVGIQVPTYHIIGILRRQTVKTSTITIRGTNQLVKKQ